MKSPFRITGIREKLEPLVKKIDCRWGDYTREWEDITKKLVDAGFLVIPQFNSNDSIPERQIKVIRSILERKDDQVVVIPFQSGIVPDKNLSSVMKKDPIIVLRPNGKDALDEQLLSKIRGVSVEDLLVGYDWQTTSSNDRRYIVTSLNDCYKGYFLSLLEHPAIRNIKVETKFHETGNIIVEKVPSLSSRRLYKMDLNGFLALAKGEKADPNKTFMFNTTHYCDKDIFNMLKAGRWVPGLGDRYMSFRTGKEKYECYHSALALKMAKRAMMDEHSKELYDPFIEPRKKESRMMFDAMNGFVLCQDKEGHFYLPNNTITEIALWKYIGYNNHVNRMKRTSSK